MFISKEIFSWAFGRENGSSPDSDYITRAYEIWRHAKSKLELEPSEFDRADCISALKRSVDNRIKSLRAAYSLDDLPTPHGKKRQLEKLEEYGLVRPAILTELFELRNVIEHNDEPPPELDKCRFYVDITWYFLKSTDGLLDMITESLVYEEGNSTISLFFYPTDKWAIRLQGDINEQYVSQDRKNGYLELTEAKASGWGDRSMLVSIEGVPVVSDELMCMFAREYFSASGYYYEDNT